MISGFIDKIVAPFLLPDLGRDHAKLTKCQDFWIWWYKPISDKDDDFHWSHM